MIVPGMIWTANDAVAVNEFLKSPVGIKWLAVLMSSKPKLDISKGTEVAALGGAYAAGYEYLLYEIIPNTRAVRAEETVSRQPIDMVRD